MHEHDFLNIDCRLNGEGLAQWVFNWFKSEVRGKGQLGNSQAADVQPMSVSVEGKGKEKATHYIEDERPTSQHFEYQPRYEPAEGHSTYGRLVIAYEGVEGQPAFDHAAYLHPRPSERRAAFDKWSAIVSRRVERPAASVKESILSVSAKCASASREWMGTVLRTFSRSRTYAAGDTAGEESTSSSHLGLESSFHDAAPTDISHARSKASEEPADDRRVFREISEHCPDFTPAEYQVFGIRRTRSLEARKTSEWS